MSRSGIMLCYPFEEKRFQKWGGKAIIQPKLDGERCRALINAEGKVLLLSSECNEIVSVPHINAQLEGLGLRNVELDGELYRHGVDFSDLHSIIGRTKNLHVEHKMVQFHVFDIVDFNSTQVGRLASLQTLFHFYKCEDVVMVQSQLVESLDDIMQEQDVFARQGYEGFIVRHPGAPYVRKRSVYVMKFKPKKRDLYRIIGTQEEVSIHGESKGTLGALICVSADEATIFNVGTGFTRDQRVEMWRKRDELVGKWAEVNYQHLTTGKGVPRFPVFVSVVEHL